MFSNAEIYHLTLHLVNTRHREDYALELNCANKQPFLNAYKWPNLKSKGEPSGQFYRSFYGYLRLVPTKGKRRHSHPHQFHQDLKESFC